jgi:hypothetical protein
MIRGTLVAESLRVDATLEGGWYVDFHSPTKSFVVFAGRILRYTRGDKAGRAEAEAYARSRGVPDAQLDWPE